MHSLFVPFDVPCTDKIRKIDRLFPGVCISLDQGVDVLTSPLSRVQLVITRDEEVEAEALLTFKREVAGTPFTFGLLPLEVELEVADIGTMASRLDVVLLVTQFKAHCSRVRM
jgi:hypothetical protein